MEGMRTDGGDLEDISRQRNIDREWKTRKTGKERKERHYERRKK